MDARGTVTFIADDEFYGSKGLNHGVYRSEIGKGLTCLVRSGEAQVPGGVETLHTIRGLQTDADAGNFIFNAFDSGQQRGLYHWANGRLTLVALLPGEAGPLSVVKYGALEGNRVLYQASTAKGENVLVLHDLTSGGDQVLFHSAAAGPSAKVQTAASFLTEQNWMTTDSILFRAGDRRNSSFYTVTGRPGIYGWLGIRAAAGNSPRRVCAPWSTAAPPRRPQRRQSGGSAKHRQRAHRRAGDGVCGVRQSVLRDLLHRTLRRSDPHDHRRRDGGQRIVQGEGVLRLLA